MYIIEVISSSTSLNNIAKWVFRRIQQIVFTDDEFGYGFIIISVVSLGWFRLWKMIFCTGRAFRIRLRIILYGGDFCALVMYFFFLLHDYRNIRIMCERERMIWKMTWSRTEHGTIVARQCEVSSHTHTHA